MMRGIPTSEFRRWLLTTAVTVIYAILSSTDVQSADFDPLNVTEKWEPVKIFDYKYVYGYPADFIGFDIGRFFIDSPEKNASNETGSTPMRFYYQGIELPGMGGIFKANEKLYSTEDATPSTRNLRVYPPSDHPLYSESTIDKMREYFTKCENKSQFGGMTFCDYRGFYKILDHPLSRNFIGWTADSVSKTQLYVYWFCRVTLRSFEKEIRETSNVICPNPCSVKISRCSLMENTATAVMSRKLVYSISESNCVKQDDGFFEGDYKCICREGYTWKPSAKACAPTDACARDGERDPCDREGTLHCVSFIPPPIEDEHTAQMETVAIKMKAHYHCVCRPGYMGYRCERPRDACVESGLITQGSGEQACRTFLGNQCVPHLGTDHYSCKCFGIWMHDNRFPFPNCYQRRQICDRVLCHNRGTCRSSIDQTTFDCQCEYGWTGKLCDQPDVRQWMPWGTWTTCSAPVCAGQGWQSRSRKCRVPVNKETGPGRCVGNSVEFRPCRSGCVDAIQIYTPIVKIILYFAVCLVMLQFAAGLIYALLQMEFSG